MASTYSGLGQSATQNIYSFEFAPQRSFLGATTALADIDFYCVHGCPAGYVSKFWQQQFASLYALSTIGMSYYNAAQVTLRHAMTHGAQFDINYTFSKAIDMGSDCGAYLGVLGRRFGESEYRSRIERYSEHLETLSEPCCRRLRYTTYRYCRCGVSVAVRQGPRVSVKERSRSG